MIKETNLSIQEEQNINKNMSTNVEEREIKSNLTKTTEWIGFIVAVIAILSVLSSVVIKYISLGRCLFFDFDLDYYDFSISNTSRFAFVFSLIAGVISTLLSIFIYKIWNKFLLIIQNKSCKNPYKIIMGIFVVVATLIIIVILSRIFIPEDNLTVLFGTLITIFSIIIYALIYFFQMDVGNVKVIVNVLSIVFIIFVFLAPSSMKVEYDNAKNQRIFPIIIDNFNGQIQYYVVISEGREKYSAYLCIPKKENEEDILVIITDVHKFFDINNTKITTVEFSDIKRMTTIPLTVEELISTQ